MKAKLISLLASCGVVARFSELERIANELIDNGVTIPVRCKDCEYRHDSCFAGNGNTYCDFHHKYFPLDGFCNHGERKGVDCEIAENIESCEDCGFCAMLGRKHNG